MNTFKVNIVPCIRRKHKMIGRTSDVARSPEHGVTFEEVDQEAFTKEQFNQDLENNLTIMLSQEEGGEKALAGEATGGEGEDDDDDDDGDDDNDDDAYESPKDPFPREVRWKPTEDELDKDFDPNEEV
jgi:hypothetical protein